MIKSFSSYLFRLAVAVTAGIVVFAGVAAVAHADTAPFVLCETSFINPIPCEEPIPVPVTYASCCSSVLFIPGLEASRTYSPLDTSLGLPLGLNSTTTVRGWEPLSNQSVATLYLNPDGSSINPNVYSGQPIDRAYGLNAYDIYGTFMKSLDDLVANGTINEWKAFGYDWRKPIAKVVAGPEKKATTTESLVDMVVKLASRSKTGKVTLIAHSNGGLVAKYLVKTLADMNKVNLVDKVISVAVPYLGTPLAIPSLLYGDGTSLGYGLLMKQSVAQKLGVNMPSAYSLLPSATYFSEVFGPTVAYASGSSTPITTSLAQDSLISSKLNGVLMAAAESLHAVLDPWEWPAAIQRWALVGYGNNTVSSLIYAKSGSDKHIASTTLLGDSTVVAQSAMYNSGTTTTFDLPAISKLESKSLNHQNILSASTTEAVVADIIQDKATADSLGQIPGVSIGLPAHIGATTRIVVSTHSPVDLHVYDSQGNHTGIIGAPTGSGVTDDVVKFYETKIPGSTFEQNGGDGTGDDSDTEIGLPVNTGQIYSVSIQGNGAGEFTYEVQKFSGDTLLFDTLYSGLPTTPLTMASTTIDSNLDASTSAPLSVDVDGDGTPDIVVGSGAALDPMSFFEAIKRTVINLLGADDKLAKDIIRRINRIEDSYAKNGSLRLDSSVNRLISTLGHKRYSSISAGDKTAIVAMISQFLTQFEK